MGIRQSTVAVVVLIVLYSVLQVGFVRPHLPADARPNLARPPILTQSDNIGLAAWRDAYRAGPGRALTWTRNPGGWARTHLGMTVQVLVFMIAAIVLLVMRNRDLTAQLCVLALALSAVAGGGPLLGAERTLPLGTGPVLVVLAWIAGPLAFPVIALAILHFPSPSPLLMRHRWLYAVPFVVAAPMLISSAAAALYLVGVEGARGLTLWDAAHPRVYYASFALALGLNVIALVEGVNRYRTNQDANARRRIRIAVYTAVPGVFGYAMKDGLPMVAGLAGATIPPFPWPIAAVLQGLILLPAFGLTYAVGVARVVGPALVLKRSLQYALANQALAVLTILPAAALVFALLNQTLLEIITSGSIAYLLLFVAALTVARYRTRARQWLDQRFFREEYDARKILLSLANRVRFESDPGDLASLVVEQIDEALHPRISGMLVSGVTEGRLVAVHSRGGKLSELPLDGGLVTVLGWSDEPLEIFLDDPRSPARRLPPAELDWIEKTGIRLIVPVLGRDRALVGALALGEKRSEEPYSAGDRELLASIAAQVGLGLDMARSRSLAEFGSEPVTQRLTPGAAPLALMECPRCGRCEESTATLCPSDGAPLQRGATAREIDGKYRIEQVLGRGGMGKVYRARDLRLDRQVAIKVVRPELLDDPGARRRFRREAQLVARLQHPGIVSVYDFGTLVGGGAFLVMELVRGEDLRRVLQREGRIAPARAVRILVAVCAAIEAAHREGVLHRDLKPENIVLPDGDGEAKVLDFGVAKLVSDRAPKADVDADAPAVLTAVGTIVGTPAYMAPEQLRAEAPEPRTDVFALGVIGYEMLAGDLPFSRGALTEVVLAQARGATPLSQRDATIPPLVDQAVMRALSMNADDRPASPQAFAAELQGSTAVLA